MMLVAIQDLSHRALFLHVCRCVTFHEKKNCVAYLEINFYNNTRTLARMQHDTEDLRRTTGGETERH